MPRGRRRHRFELNADVNVVSLIDVMLLLLVIFMITAPMMESGVDLTLPQADAKPLESKSGLTITVTKAGEILIDNQKLQSVAEFKILFKALPANRTKNGVYLMADQNVNYGLVVQLLAIMNADGVTNVGLEAAPEETK